MNQKETLENSLEYAIFHHPVDEMEPLDERDQSRLGEFVCRLFIWVAGGTTLDQRGVRATVILYCHRPDQISEKTLEQIGLSRGVTRERIHNLVGEYLAAVGLPPDFCKKGGFRE